MRLKKLHLLTGLGLLTASAVVAVGLFSSECFTREWYGKCVDSGTFKTRQNAYQIPHAYRSVNKSDTAHDRQGTWLSPQLSMVAEGGGPGGHLRAFTPGVVMFRIFVAKSEKLSNDFAHFSQELKLAPYEGELNYEPPVGMLKGQSTYTAFPDRPRDPAVNDMVGYFFVTPSFEEPTFVVTCPGPVSKPTTCQGMMYVEPGVQVGFTLMYPDLPRAVEISDKLKALILSWRTPEKEARR